MPRKKRPDPRPDVLARLREICLGLPSVTEASSYGNPAFKAFGKTFVVLDHYRGSDCVWVLCDPERRAETLSAAGFFPSPYDPRQKAVCGEPDVIDWAVMSDLIRESHLLAAEA